MRFLHNQAPEEIAVDVALYLHLNKMMKASELNTRCL